MSPEDEDLAAEYALGTLDAAERASLAARRLREPELDAAIAAWEARLSPLAEAAPALDPPPDLFARIEARLDGPAIPDLAALRSRLTRWRAATAAASALAAAFAFALLLRPAPPHQFVAVLQKSADAPAFAMTVDIDRLEFSVRPVAASAPADKSYELWIIPPGAAPKSLGVIDAATDGKHLDDPKAIVREATYAVTVEPKGGSPNGKPSGAPVFFGKLVPVGP